MIMKGDCISVMKAMKPNSVDAVVTDPPYGLEFMGKEWDQLKTKGHWDGNRGWQGDTKDAYGRYQGTAPSKYQAGLEMQLWHTQWLTEAYRVLKPGGSMLVMGGTRTSHRLACAIEDSGFIIKDTLMWIYGSGFPKAQDVSVLVDAKILGISTKEIKEKREVIGKYKPPQDCPKNKWTDKNALYHRKITSNIKFNEAHTPECMNITKPLTPEGEHWDGFKVGGIKPAYEPIIWAVKPPEGSYVDNVLKWGVGAVNVNECRIGIEEDKIKGGNSGEGWFGATKATERPAKGRFPANVILSHHPECVKVGVKRVKGDKRGSTGGKINYGRDYEIYNSGLHDDKRKTPSYGNPDGLETIESWDCHPDCPIRLLDKQSGELKSGERNPSEKPKITNVAYGEFKRSAISSFPANSGGASRFFYCAKASRRERNAGLEEAYKLKENTPEKIRRDIEKCLSI